ncbi:hypothetical protein T4E_10371 [Trichinella pseudospiralis]|uniref:Uncharacterized protein n=1 Tax=Trichinella pseudospiralis TaxID=6337 RepID=A0A0V0YIB3_TRIPS|nr:hypothetical protein T4E_10371 [Trichinella pseudospiralis]
METLIIQRPSGNAAAGDLKRVNRVYAEKQRQVIREIQIILGNRRTLEQFLEALMYLSSEPIVVL